MNTATARHVCFDWVFNWCSMFSSAKQKSRNPKNDTDRSDIPKEELLEYIHDNIPILKGVDIPGIRAWKCPEQALPLPMFRKGDLVVWNDEYISPTHGARARFKDDEPFTVRIVDDFIIALVRDENGRLVTQAPKVDRITLVTSSGWIINAHPGYFKLFKE